MITADDVRAAASRITGVAKRTPVLTSRLFDSEAGGNAFFKCEMFQRGGAFKIRGAINFLRQIPASDLPRGVVAYSSGNHAQAVAIAARELQTSATIVMPHDAPPAKVAATAAYGARVVRYDRLREDREAIGRGIAAESGATLVPPYDHPWTMAGQGTAALELLEDYPEIDTLVVPVGGGGLLSGCATIAKDLHPSLAIIGVEPEAANDTYLSLQAGRRVQIPPPDTIADGLRAQQPGALTFPVIERLVSEIVLVSEDEIRAAQQFLATRLKIVAEPSGATSAAAVLFRKLPREARRVGVILSGGNV